MEQMLSSTLSGMLLRIAVLQLARIALDMRAAGDHRCCSAPVALTMWRLSWKTL